MLQAAKPQSASGTIFCSKSVPLYWQTLVLEELSASTSAGRPLSVALEPYWPRTQLG